MENLQERRVQFDDIKKELTEKYEDFAKKSGIQEPVTLVDGFINQPYNMEVSNSIMIGSPIIPMVMLLGDESGRIYLFALKAILDV